MSDIWQVTCFTYDWCECRLCYITSYYLFILIFGLSSVSALIFGVNYQHFDRYHSDSGLLEPADVVFIWLVPGHAAKRRLLCHESEADSAPALTGIPARRGLSHRSRRAHLTGGGGRSQQTWGGVNTTVDLCELTPVSLISAWNVFDFHVSVEHNRVFRAGLTSRIFFNCWMFFQHLWYFEFIVSGDFICM